MSVVEPAVFKSKDDEYREFLWNVFGDNECWVECDGDVFGTSSSKMFTSKNFDVFLYDPKSKKILVRPMVGMHKTIVDNYESLPNREETKKMVADDTYMEIGVYLVGDEEDGNYKLEALQECTLADFIIQHPHSISLIPQ